MSDDLIPNQLLTLVTIIGGLICVYASSIQFVGGLFSIVLVVLATVFGANTLRHVGKYSLGTGVPSIVYLLTSIGLISFILSIVLSIQLNQPVLFPIIGIISTSLLSLIISLICKHVFGIQVEILSKSFIFISIAALFVIMGMSTLIAQTYNPNIIYESIIQNGIVLLLMILSIMVIQNPYNSCLGPNEDQYRTLSLAVAEVFLMLVLVSAISILTSKYWIVYLLLSLVGWFISFRQYIIYTKHQAASIKRYGLWPQDDGES